MSLVSRLASAFIDGSIVCSAVWLFIFISLVERAVSPDIRMKKKKEKGKNGGPLFSSSGTQLIGVAAPLPATDGRTEHVWPTCCVAGRVHRCRHWCQYWTVFSAAHTATGGTGSCRFAAYLLTSVIKGLQEPEDIQQRTFHVFFDLFCRVGLTRSVGVDTRRRQTLGRRKWPFSGRRARSSALADAIATFGHGFFCWHIFSFIGSSN